MAGNLRNESRAASRGLVPEKQSPQLTRLASSSHTKHYVWGTLPFAPSTALIPSPTNRPSCDLVRLLALSFARSFALLALHLCGALLQDRTLLHARARSSAAASTILGFCWAAFGSSRHSFQSDSCSLSLAFTSRKMQHDSCRRSC
jgi:hypothetical protein